MYRVPKRRAFGTVFDTNPSLRGRGATVAGSGPSTRSLPACQEGTMNHASRHFRASRGLTVGVAATAILALAAGCAFAAARAFQGNSPWPYAGTSDSSVLAAVGDIACQPAPNVEKEKT